MMPDERKHSFHRVLSVALKKSRFPTLAIAGYSVGVVIGFVIIEIWRAPESSEVLQEWPLALRHPGEGARMSENVWPFAAASVV